MKKTNEKKFALAKSRQIASRRRSRRVVGFMRARAQKRTARIASVSAPFTILAPIYLRLYAKKEIRRETESFFEQLNRNLTNGKQVVIDFSPVERLFPCGLLILMGWVDEWISRFPGRLFAKYPKEDLVEQMLQHVGVLKKLGLPERKKVDHNDVKRWHFFHGQNADATPIEPFMLDLQSLLGEERQLGLCNCVTEAMINVGHHAYLSSGSGSWWIFATISEKTVFIAIYDHGESIPATLLSKPLVKDFLTGRMWLQARGDSKLITAAVGGRTRTQLPYRGKGLPEMLEFTKSNPNSELGIFSRKGFFQYDDHEKSGKLKTPIKGTLVIWKLKVSGIKND
jgi:hypothetical protein